MPVRGDPTKGPTSSLFAALKIFNIEGIEGIVAVRLRNGDTHHLLVRHSQNGEERYSANGPNQETWTKT